MLPGRSIRRFARGAPGRNKSLRALALAEMLTMLTADCHGLAASQQAKANAQSSHLAQ
jgi:hypothetical protein